MGDLDNSDGESPDYVLVWAEFKEELYNNFGSTFPEEEAEEALKNLEMDPKWRAIKYFVLFGKYMSRTSWNDRAYTSRAYDGLPRRIKDRIAEIFPKPTTYEGLRALALQIDQRYWEYKRELENENKSNRKNNNSSSGSNSNNNSNNSSNNNNSNRGSGSSKKKGKPCDSGSSSSKSGNNSNDPPKHLGPDGKLTATERDRRIKEGLCLVCGNRVHMAKDCSKAKYANSGSSGSTSKPDKNAKGRGSKAEETPKDANGSGKAKN